MWRCMGVEKNAIDQPTLPWFHPCRIETIPALGRLEQAVATSSMRKYFMNTCSQCTQPWRDHQPVTALSAVLRKVIALSHCTVADLELPTKTLL
jgi:hypothetical protein